MLRAAIAAMSLGVSGAQAQVVGIEEILAACGGERLVLQAHLADGEAAIPDSVLGRIEEVLSQRIGIGMSSRLIENRKVTLLDRARFEILVTGELDMSVENLLWPGYGLTVFEVLGRQDSGVTRADEMVFRVGYEPDAVDSFLLVKARPLVEDIRLSSVRVDRDGGLLPQIIAEVLDEDLHRIREVAELPAPEGLLLTWWGRPLHWGRTLNLSDSGRLRMWNLVWQDEIQIMAHLMAQDVLDRHLSMVSRDRLLPSGADGSKCGQGLP